MTILALGPSLCPRPQIVLPSAGKGLLWLLINPDVCLCLKCGCNVREENDIDQRHLQGVMSGIRRDGT